MTEHPALYAFEMSNHPKWFLWHKTKKPYSLILKKVKKITEEVMDATFFLTPTKCPEEKRCKPGDRGFLVDIYSENNDIVKALKSFMKFLVHGNKRETCSNQSYLNLRRALK